MEVDEQDTLQKSVHHISNSSVLLITRLVGLLFLIETAYVFLLIIANIAVPPSLFPVTLNALWLAQTLKFILEIGGVLAVVVPWSATNYYISNGQLIRYQGIRRRDETIFDLATLKSIELHQSWLGRMFDFGDIALTFSSSGYTEKTTLFGIYNPKKYERYLKEKLGTAEESAA